MEVRCRIYTDKIYFKVIYRDLNIRSDRQEKKHEPDAVSAAESEQEGDMEVLSMLATKRLLRTMKAHAHVSSFCEKA